MMKELCNRTDKTPAVGETGLAPVGRASGGKDTAHGKAGSLCGRHDSQEGKEMFGLSHLNQQDRAGGGGWGVEGWGEISDGGSNHVIA